MMKNRLKYVYVLSSVIILLIALAQCNEQKAKDIRGPQYVSEQTCIKCHRDIYDNYLHTAHFKTSAPVNPAFAGYYKNPYGVTYLNEEIVAIEKRKDSLFQVLESHDQRKSYPVQVAFGSGEKAQTFGYWQGDKLYQLPLTYLSAGSKWVNSPGFNVNHPYFERAIVSRCFECHSSYVEAEVKFKGFQKEETLKAASILYGIDCQRCHGPAAEHVDFHTGNPGEKKARYIVRYNELSRAQKIDMCGVCHSGNDQTAVRSTFSFVPGDTVSNFFYQDFNTQPSPDVHGKQVQQLMRSKCYQKSAVLNCTTCHDVHKRKQSLISYDQKCISCHQQTEHPEGLNTTNCVACHMPLMASGVIKFESAKDKASGSYFLRSHIIKVY